MKKLWLKVLRLKYQPLAQICFVSAAFLRMGRRMILSPVYLSCKKSLFLSGMMALTIGTGSGESNL